MSAGAAPSGGAVIRPRQIGVNAGFGRRLAALIYDAFLVAALLIAFTLAVALIFNHGTALVSETVGAWVWVYRTGLIGVVATYYIVNWTRSGQTLGMRAWHLRVVTAQGGRLGVARAMFRLVLGWAAWMPFALGVLWLYVDPEHLALNDRLSDTRLVRLERR